MLRIFAVLCALPGLWFTVGGAASFVSPGPVPSLGTALVLGLVLLGLAVVLWRAGGRRSRGGDGAAARSAP